MPYYRRNTCILSVTIFLAALSWNQVMPFLPLFLREMDVEPDMLPYWIGVAFAAQSLASMLAQPFWGKLGDARGRKPMILRAGFCLAGVYFGMSFCNTPLQLTLLRFLNGALTGFIPGSYALIATNTPQQYAPRSLATAQAAANVGLVAGPFIGGLLAHLAGYRGSMQVAGTAVLISTFVVWWLVREPNKPAPVEKTSLGQDFATSVRSPVLSSLMLVGFIAWTFGSSVSPYLALHITNLLGNGPEWVVGAVFSLPAVAFLLTAHTWTRIGEGWGFDRIILVGLIGGGLGAIVLALTRDIWAFAITYFITGIWLAALSPATASLTCLRVDESFRGRAYAIQQSAGTFGGLIGPLVAARIAAAYGINHIFVFVAAVLISGSFAFRLLVRRWAKTGSRD